MIETIIKRSGEEEAFQPSKVNSWGEWASKTLGNYVDWPSVVLQTVSTLPKKCTSTMLQERLIKTCLDNDSWSYNRMAGRLYAAFIYKKLYGGKIPTVKEVHTKLQGLGLMVVMDYSDEEYEEVEKLINHKLDFKAAHYELHQIRSKYALRSRVTGDEYESQQFVFMRMAMALAEDQPKERRMQDLAKWYEHFSLKRINAPTPNYVNLGTPLKGFASCCIYTTEDSARSLAAGDHIAYTMTYMSAGIGAHINTRSLGDSVRGGVIQHQGKLNYYRSLVGAIKANLQNGRGGAATTYYNAFDPEIDVISRLKNPMSTEDKKIRGMDYNLGCNKFFAKRVAMNEDVFLFNSFTAPDLYAAFYNSDDYKFEDLYIKYENDAAFNKTYVSAREIALTALNEAYETGRSYLHWADEMNRHTPFKEPIYSSNLCVAPETTILTDSGYKEIASLKDKAVNVWNGSEWSEVTVRQTGVDQKLIKVVTKDGYELECTPHHKFFKVIRNPETLRTKTYKVEAKDLRAGDKLIKFELPIIEGSEQLENAYVNGFFTGDGCEYKGTQIIYLYGKKRELGHLFDKEVFNTWTTQEAQDREVIISHRNVLRHKFFVPGCDFTVQSRLDWLAGVLDSDGTVVRNGDTQGFQIGSINKGFLKEAQMMLQTLGIQSKVTANTKGGMRMLPLNDGTGEYGEFMCQDTFRLLIGNDGLSKLKALGLVTHRLETTDHKPNRECSQFIKVMEVVDEGRTDDTYCFTEPKRGKGMFNGMLTGQCAEISLPTKGYKSTEYLYRTDDHGKGEIALCSLGGVNIPNIESDEQYYEVVYYTLLMIDKCIHMSEYELPHMGVTAKARLNAGVGIMGLAHSMAKAGVKYATLEGKRHIHEASERHSYMLIKASLQLGKELGNAKWMSKTKWPEGWLPIDTYKKSVDSVVDSELMYDWETLRKEIIENGGIRNSSVVAHMPGESSTKASGTTNGLYAIRDFTLIKTDNNSVNYWAAPEGEKLKKKYDIAWDIPTKDLIDCYAIVQKFTDQAISADLYRKVIGDEVVPSTEMLQDFLYMTKMGLKTRYYQNSKTSMGMVSDEEDCESCKL